MRSGFALFAKIKNLQEVKSIFRGGSRISGKGFICIKVWGLGRFADFISFFLNTP